MDDVADVHPLRASLEQGLATLNLALSAAQVGQLLRYLDQLARWNRVYNLTSVREPRDMLSQHLLDALAVIVPLQRRLGAAPARLLDVGSGGGLPGVVIAICCPGFDVTCVDAVGKKVAFVQQMAGVLALPNLHARHARVEQVTDSFDGVVSRAFASLVDFTAWSMGALAPGGIWMAMKGRQPDEEVAALPAAVEVFHVEPLQVPGLDAERCLVWLRRTGDSS